MFARNDLEQKTDEALWELLLERKVMVLEILYKRHYDLLLNYGMKVYPNKDLVQDCIQDFFVKLHQSGKLSHTECVKTYFLKALRNLLIDKLSAVKETVDLEKVSFQMTIDDSVLSRLFDKNDEDIRLSHQLLEAIQQLPVNQRETIYLRYVKGMAYKEIAGVLGIASQSSMNLVARAIAKLRTVMQLEKILLLLLMLR